MNYITFSHLDSDGPIGKMYGRLGNQLFQVSAMYGECRRSKRQMIIPSNWKYRPFFDIPDHCYGEVEGTVNYIYNEHQYRRMPVGYNLDIGGYFQSLKYFDDFRQDIRDMFLPDRVRLPNDYCAIHIRRTDYLTNDFWYKPPIKHYLSILDTHNESKVLVFSDDIEWCKSNLPSDFTFSEGNSDIEDLWLMANCRRIITAASSYSWWGAYLSGHSNVHLPERWIGNIPYSNTELVREGWTIGDINVNRDV